MENKQRKEELWERLKSNYSHLENYCTINLRGIEDDTMYFHPTFIIDSEAKITTQCDVGTNNNLYAFRFELASEKRSFVTELYESAVQNVIIGYHTNKEAVILALDTLYKVREHTRNIENYTHEYINGVLLGSSIKEITNAFINELNTTSKVVEFMQKKG